MHLPLALAASCLLALPCALAAADPEVPRPSLREIHHLTSVHLQAELRADGSIGLRWQPANQAPSDGIKIVAADHRMPWYPHDQGLQWIAGTGHTEAHIPPGRIDRTRPQFVRVIFVRAGDHDRDHVAVSNIFEIPAADHGTEPDAWGGKPQHHDHQAPRPATRDPWEPVAAAPTAATPAEPVAPDLPPGYEGNPAAEYIATEVADLQREREALARRLAEAEARAD